MPLAQQPDPWSKLQVGGDVEVKYSKLNLILIFLPSLEATFAYLFT